MSEDGKRNWSLAEEMRIVTLAKTDDRYYELLYRQYKPMIHKALCLHAPRRDRRDYEEILSLLNETFCRIVKRYDPKRGFRLSTLLWPALIKNKEIVNYKMNKETVIRTPYLNYHPIYVDALDAYELNDEQMDTDKLKLPHTKDFTDYAILEMTLNEMLPKLEKSSSRNKKTRRREYVSYLLEEYSPVEIARAMGVNKSRIRQYNLETIPILKNLLSDFF